MNKESFLKNDIESKLKTRKLVTSAFLTLYMFIYFLYYFLAVIECDLCFLLCHIELKSLITNKPKLFIFLFCFRYYSKKQHDKRTDAKFL